MQEQLKERWKEREIHAQHILRDSEIEMWMKKKAVDS